MPENNYSFQGLIVSLAIHILAVLFFLYWRPPAPVSHSETAEVTFIESAAKPQKSFVTDTDLGRLQKQLDDKAKFLSRFNRRVKKEMRARNNGPTRNSVPRAAQRSQKTISSSMKGLEPRQNHGIGGQVLRHQGATSQVAIGPSSLAEMVPGVQEGAFTALNTDQFTYYGFFSRVNEQVRYRWVNKIRNYAASLSNRDLARLGQYERVTQIEIVLNKNGDFLKGFVHRSSGDRQLDQAGIDGFSQAAPFINPPKGLVEDDGLIHLHYSFYVQFQPRPLSGPGMN